MEVPNDRPTLYFGITPSQRVVVLSESGYLRFRAMSEGAEDDDVFAEDEDDEAVDDDHHEDDEDYEVDSASLLPEAFMLQDTLPPAAAEIVDEFGTEEANMAGFEWMDIESEHASALRQRLVEAGFVIKPACSGMI